MRFLSESGTDEAYVEGARAWLTNPRPSRRRHLYVFFVLVTMAMVVPMLIMKGLILVTARQADGSFMFYFATAQWAGMPLAAMGYSLLLAARIRRGFRLDRLMIQYHDELKDTAGTPALAEESTVDQWDGYAGHSLKSRALRWLFRKDYALKAKTDLECVTMARATLKRYRWVAWICLGAAAIHLVCLLGFFELAYSNASRLPAAQAGPGFVAGLTSGLLGASMMWLGIDHYIELLLSLRPPRVARLLVTFHDALADGARQDNS